MIPNPWDRGSAVVLQSLRLLGHRQSSAGFAFSRGLPDDPNVMSRDAVLEHLLELVAATTIPVNADYQSGYASDPEKLGRSVKLCVGTGVAGLSIEDASGDPGAPLFDFEMAVERMRAAREAIDETGSGVVLTGRSECFLVGPRPLRNRSAACRRMPRRARMCSSRPGCRIEVPFARSSRRWRPRRFTC